METSKTVRLFCPVFTIVAEGPLKTHGQCFVVSITTSHIYDTSTC